jgi:hypothetical protein
MDESNSSVSGAQTDAATVRNELHCPFRKLFQFVFHVPLIRDARSEKKNGTS